jgi:hypothetical protein
MATQERFVVNKPNKDDHKGVKKAADGVKQGVGIVGFLLTLGVGIKKYGPKLLSIITKK